MADGPDTPGGATVRRAGRSGLIVAVVLVSVLVSVAVAAVQWSGSGGSGMSGMHGMSGMSRDSMPLADPPRWADGTLAVPTRYLGPQGGVGQFVAACRYSHSGEVDPIVFPGTVGRSHRHDFYGATNTEEHSTPDSLRAGGTTCDKPGDDAAYWQPTLWNGDTVVVPTRIHAYYRAAPGIDPTKVVAFPDGLKMLAGDPFADGSSAASVEAAGWTCGARTDLLAEPPSCPATAPLAMVLTFPDCWDGEHADVVGHRDHMTYSRNGACPSTHPVSVPQLTVSITFPISGPGHDLRLASGSVHSAHGDFFNGWDSSALKEQIRICIHRRLVCELASNRQEESLFQTR